MDAIIELVTAPVQPWDALICTSNAVKSNVERLLQAQVDYLVARLGIAKIVMPQMPVIPLGIHTGDFVFSDKQREAGRKSLGADSDTMVVLFMGRLSFHAKAHPLAMYQALEMASAASGKKVILVECGWHANDHICNAFSEAAAYASPNVTVVTLDGRNADSRTDAWASADVFCSLSDNIQETFGITPIEAMAAGLPVVVADWDGYKDTVRQEVDGFRIPTLLPQPGLGNDLSSRHALGIDTYDLYCGNACMLSAVDIEATAGAFTKLFSSPDLRARMGQAGRDRARSTYDWANIIPQYEKLWENLSEIRKSQGGSLPALAHAWPARMDPFYAFATYPTQALTAETVLELGNGGDLSLSLNRVAEMRKLAMVRFTPVSLADDDEIAAMLAQLAGGTMKAADVVAHISEARRPYAMRSLVWLAKLGVVRAMP
jgi:glycosyltransferase involved in cell wall biosynthesis